MKEKSQSTDKASDAKDKDERLSHDKYQTTAGPVCKPTKSTASTSVPFWKDQKIWIQIAIVVQLYVFSLAILSVCHPFSGHQSYWIYKIYDQGRIYENCKFHDAQGKDSFATAWLYESYIENALFLLKSFFLFPGIDHTPWINSNEEKRRV